MMRMILLCFFCLLSVRTSHGQNLEFYERVLSDVKCMYCYFVVLDVESDAYDGKVVIENGALYDFLKKTKGFDKTEYKEFMKDLLLSKKKLALDNASMDGGESYLNVKDAGEREFRVVIYSDRFGEAAAKVEAASSKGCVPFIKHYFLGEPLDRIEQSGSADCAEFIGNQKEVLLARGVTLGDRERDLIIDKLFEWHIPTRIDDLSTLLVIEGNPKPKR
jgi:hypothetical protein